MIKKILFILVAIGLALAFYGEFSLSKLVKKIEGEYVNFECNKVFETQVQSGSYMLSSYRLLSGYTPILEDPVPLANDSSAYPIDSAFLSADVLSLKHDSVYLSVEDDIIAKRTSELVVSDIKDGVIKIMEIETERESATAKMKTTILDKEHTDLRKFDFDQPSMIRVESEVYDRTVHGFSIVPIDESRKESIRKKYLMLIVGSVIAFIAGTILIILVMRKYRRRS